MIRCICVGRIKERSLQENISEYLKRMQAYHKLEIVEVADEATTLHNNKAMEKEGARILAKIKEKEYVVLLDLRGETFDSVSFADRLDNILATKGNQVVFVIGGSQGVSKEVFERADLYWKLSDCTFPHGIVRLLLVEQIYRAFRILNKEPYHK